MNPVEFFTDAFSSELTQRALLGGLLAATTTALIGTWVVVRGLAFFADALAHGVLPGHRRRRALGLRPHPRCARQRRRHGRRHRPRAPHDPARPRHRHRAAVRRDARARRRDHQPRGHLRRRPHGVPLRRRARRQRRRPPAGRRRPRRDRCSASSPGTGRSSPSPSNRDKATTLGLRPDLAHVAMLALLALSIVASFRAVGTLLVFGLLVAPPATAMLHGAAAARGDGGGRRARLVGDGARAGRELPRRHRGVGHRGRRSPSPSSSWRWR